MHNLFAEKLRSLTVFRSLLQDEVIQRLLKLLSSPCIDSYAAFTHSLYNHTDSLTDYILNAVLEDENTFMKRLAAFEEVPFYISDAVKKELRILEEISQLKAVQMQITLGLDSEIPLARWNTRQCDFSAAYSERMNDLSTKGYGIFSKYTAFCYKDGKLIPVSNPDKRKLSELVGYEHEKDRLINNTLALLNNKPAANTLLYGDAGTGKSTAVKVVANEYSGIGLRLIEVKKSQLPEIPDIMALISKNPLKFILFIDDISFAYEDDSFNFLKAVLEGSVSVKTPNMVIYATSNRRNIIRESFSEREGGDIHAGDTREQMVSLSERFGLKIPFLKPNKDLYLKIVENLAVRNNIPYDEQLFTKAEAYSLRRNGRSGRTAKHFIESVLSGETVLNIKE